MERNILLKIAYDGTDFCGWQRQPNVPTVQGEIERVLSILCSKDIVVNGTSRTDAGVHAFGQQASFCGEFAIPTGNIMRAANNLLDPAVQIVEVCEKPLDFHARFDSKGKTYIYKIYNSRRKDPFHRNGCYFVDKELNVEAMQQAAKHIVGTHDFKCFEAAGGQPRETTVRTVSDLKITARTLEDKSSKDDERWFEPKEIVIEITGDGFLYNMVRIITGTLVEVGMGRIEADQVEEIVAGMDRTKAGHTAPPQGLYLKEIYY